MKYFLLFFTLIFVGCATGPTDKIEVTEPEKLYLYCIGGEGVWSRLKARRNALITQFSTGEDFEPDADPYVEPLVIYRAYESGKGSIFNLKSRDGNLKIKFRHKRCLKKKTGDSQVREESEQRICEVTHFDFTYRGCGEYFLQGKPDRLKKPPESKNREVK